MTSTPNDANAQPTQVVIVHDLDGESVLAGLLASRLEDEASVVVRTILTVGDSPSEGAAASVRLADGELRLHSGAATGLGTPPRALLNLTRYPLATDEWPDAPCEVWTLLRDGAHGLERAPLGFWELRDGAALSTLVLARQERNGGYTRLRRAAVRSRTWSASANRAEVARAAAQLVALVAARPSPPTPSTVASTEAASLRWPSRSDIALVRARGFFELARKSLLSVTRREQWAVGVVPHRIEELLKGTGVAGARWLPEPGERQFLADPHGLQRDGVLTILAEDLDVRGGRGVISAVEVGGGATSKPRPVLESSVHLSYPYLIEADGEVYCVPESQAAREVALFRALEFPDRWERVATLIEGRALVDASIIQHEGRWWCWAGDAAASDNATLTLWSASTLTGPWVEHPESPVLIDAGRARPAGTPFLVDGRLYRPGQDCSTGYGARVILHEVTELTTEHYTERQVGVIAPEQGGPYPAGLHTIAGVGDVTLIDGKRFAWNGPADFARTARAGLRRLRR